jgi:hypothetical protein
MSHPLLGTEAEQISLHAGDGSRWVRGTHSFHTTSLSVLKCGGGVNSGCCICKRYINATFKSGHGKTVPRDHMSFFFGFFF